MKFLSRILLFSIISQVLISCTLFATPKAPKADVSADWQQQSAQSGKTVPGKWWVYFDDSALNQLIDKGAKQNTDHRLALARIREARAIAQNANAQLRPEVDVAADASRDHNSATTGLSRAGTANTFDAGFDASWELDLFGRNRQQANAAQAEERAVIADSNVTTLSLIAEITRQYTLYRLAQQQVALAQDNANAQQDILKITKARKEQGIEDNLDVSRADALLNTTRAQIPLYQSQAQAAAYQIDYLTGDKPGTNKTLLDDTTVIPLIDRDIFMDTPVNIIQNRPDIQAAQQRMIEATSLKQSTIAELYPDVSLSAALGFASGTLGNLVQSNSKTWSYGGGLLAPLFDFGRIRSEIKASKAREEEAEITFEQTVLAALRDIETAAHTYAKDKERYQMLNAAMQSSHTALDVARKQYQQGILSQLDVLQAEQAAYEADASLAQATADLTQDFIALCKALALTPGLEKPH